MANAVANALQSFGAKPRELPLSPTYIWELVQAGAEARGGVTRRRVLRSTMRLRREHEHSIARPVAA